MIPLETAHYTFRTHTSAIRSVAWSPSGKYIASAGDDKIVQIQYFETECLEPRIYTYHRHSDRVLAVAWSPDGRYLISAGLDKTVRCWPWKPTENSHENIIVPYQKTFQQEAQQKKAEQLIPTSMLPFNSYQQYEGFYRSQPICYIYHGYSGKVHQVAWSPINYYVATATSTGMVQVWDIIPGDMRLITRLA